MSKKNHEPTIRLRLIDPETGEPSGESAELPLSALRIKFNLGNLKAAQVGHIDRSTGIVYYYDKGPTGTPPGSPPSEKYRVIGPDHPRHPGHLEWKQRQTVTPGIEPELRILAAHVRN